MDVYCIPGLGADKRLFGKLRLQGHELHFLEWPTMPAGSTLGGYARVLKDRIDETKPHALVGVSMGGMVAQELAPLTKPEKVVVISSWKDPEEMPTPIRMLRGTHPERLLNKAFLRTTIPLARWQMGVETPEDVALFDELLKAHSVDQLKVQIAACVDWKGCPHPFHVSHIHGDKDRLMPVNLIKGADVVPGGTHFMVFSQGKEISERLQALLGK